MNLTKKQDGLINIEDITDNNKIFCLASAGSGKEAWVDAIYPSPKGLIRFGDVKIGDSLFDREGNPTKILNIFPQGIKDAYKVTLGDGRSSICGEEHLWTVYSNFGIKKPVSNPKTLTTLEIINKGILREDKRPNRLGSAKFYLPCNGVHNYEERSLPIHPFILGAFIGNGCLTEKGLTFSSNDIETVKKISKILGCTYKKRSINNYSWDFYKNNKRIKTKDILPSLQGKYSHENYIPNEYKYNSEENRLQLLQGLFDTDGSVCKLGTRLNTTYSSVSLKLINDIKEVLQSLGMVSSIREDIREGKRTCYGLTVNAHISKKEQLFSLNRKKDKFLDGKPARRNFDFVGIRSIEKLEEKLEMQCVEVDNEEHLYLCEDSIVTHNTLTVTKRIEHLINNKNIDSKKIALFSFSRTATGELRDRLKSSISLKDYDKLTISTFHAFCYNICKKYYKECDLTTDDFDILNSYQVARLIKTFSYDRSQIVDLDNKKIEEIVLGLLFNKYSDIEKKELFTEDKDNYVIASDVTNYMNKRDLVMYNQLIYKVKVLFSKNDKILQEYRNMFDYIILDESQDTIIHIIDVIKILVDDSTHLIVVGDILQTLYMFAGAKPFELIDMMNYFNAFVYQLDETFRFGKNISRVAERVINQIDIEDKYKIITTSNQEDAYFEFLESCSNFSDIEQAVKTVDKMAVMNIPFNEINILGRKNKFLFDLSNRLIVKGYPVVLKTGNIANKKECNILFELLNCYKKPNIESFLVLFKQIHNKINETLLINIFDTFEGRSLDELLVHVENNNIKAIGSGRKKIFIDFLHQIKGIEKVINSEKCFFELSELIDLKNMIFMNTSENGTDRYEEALDYIGVLDKIKNERKIDPFELENFITLTFASDDEKDKKGINLRTVHSSKGMTLPYNIICLNSGFFHYTDLNNKEDVFSEYCCLYVAITRAKKSLTIIGDTLKYNYLVDSNSKPRLDQLQETEGGEEVDVFEVLKNLSKSKPNLCKVRAMNPTAVLRQTDKAICLKFVVGDKWIPKSCFEIKDNQLFINSWYASQNSDLRGDR